MKLALIDGKKLIRLLNDRGFAVKRQKGSHAQLEDDIGRRITIPLASRTPDRKRPAQENPKGRGNDEGRVRKIETQGLIPPDILVYQNKRD